MAAVDKILLRDMLGPVASALGEDLLSEVVFVGGSITALLITDPFTREAVRFTQDVDLIAKAQGRGEWSRLLDLLRQRGFTESLEDDVICRMRLGSLKIDVMPDDASILGFSNRWYTDAIAHAQIYPINKKLKIRLLTAEYFIATKLEAWLGRGNNDPLSSHDLEDIINVLDGRKELKVEIENADLSVRNYIGTQLNALLNHPDFEYAVQGNVRDADHVGRVFQIIQGISGSSSAMVSRAGLLRE